MSHPQAQHASRVPSPQPLSHKGRGLWLPPRGGGAGGEGEAGHMPLEEGKAPTEENIAQLPS